METTTTNPATAARSAAAGYGTVVRTWSIQPRRQLLLGLIPTVLLALLAVAALVWAEYSTDVGLDPWLLLAAALLGAAVVVRLVALAARMRDGGRELSLFERGLIEGRDGQPRQDVGFSGTDLTDARSDVIRRGGPEGREVRMSLRDAAGVAWRLRGPAAFVVDACDLIADRHAVTRTPELLASLRGGDTLDLGTIAVSSSGVHDATGRGEPIPFEQLRRWTVERGEWTLTHGDGQQVRGHANDTINFRCLSALLRQLAPQLRT